MAVGSLGCYVSCCVLYCDFESFALHRRLISYEQRNVFKVRKECNAINSSITTTRYKCFVHKRSSYYTEMSLEGNVIYFSQQLRTIQLTIKGPLNIHSFCASRWLFNYFDHVGSGLRDCTNWLCNFETYFLQNHDMIVSSEETIAWARWVYLSLIFFLSQNCKF